MNVIKNTVIILSALYLPACFASHPTISTYQQLLKALKQGNTVRAVVAVNQCNPSPALFKADDETLWSINFTNFFKTKYPLHGEPTDAIAASNTGLKQTENGYVYDYTRVRIFSNGEMEGYNEFVNPIDLKAFVK